MTLFHTASHGLIWQKGEILLLRRSPTSRYMPGVWDFPGGTVESGETLEQALIREVREELGECQIEVSSVFSVYTNLDQLPARQTFQIVMHCQWIAGEVRLNHEHDAFLWTRPSMIGVPVMAFVTDAVTKIIGEDK